MAELSLTPGVLAAVLGAALLHAGWNALIRGAGDKGLFTLLLSACGIVLALVGVCFSGLPSAASLPYLLSSALIHTVYIAWLMRAYEGGQLALSYTLMRGLPPLMVAVLAGPLLGESLGWVSWVGVLAICGGVLLIGVAAGQSLRQVYAHPASRAALLNAGAIAAYTLVDGLGARASGNPVGYALCLFCLEPLIILALSYRRRGAAMRDYFRANWRLGMFGAFCSMLAYTTVLWAMTQAPVALVAALRETSVIFAVLLGRFLFKEGHLRTGLFAAAAVFFGISLLRLQ